MRNFWRTFFYPVFVSSNQSLRVCVSYHCWAAANKHVLAGKRNCWRRNYLCRTCHIKQKYKIGSLQEVTLISYLKSHSDFWRYIVSILTASFNNRRNKSDLQCTELPVNHCFVMSTVYYCRICFAVSVSCDLCIYHIKILTWIFHMQWRTLVIFHLFYS
jgi:hypothetical protein